MGKQSNRRPSAFKHGAYSGIALLPGEDPDDFKKLHDGLIAEFFPVGPLEGDIVATMALLLWRKQNLSTYRLAAWAQDRYSAINSKFGPRWDYELPLLGKDLRSPDQIRADTKAAEEQIRNELGDAVAFVEMDEAVTIKQLLEDLAVVDRLDGLIDRCVKRLLMARGVKSMSQPITPEPSTSRKRLAAAA